MMTILSMLPIISLLLCLIVFKFTVARSGAISLGIALVIALGFFGLPIIDGLPIAVGKALWLALFVSLIVWLAIFLYHLVDDFKAITVINENISRFVEDKFVAFLLLAWMFTGLLQGMAGFGVPAVIVTPILIALGFNGVKSLAAALLGHSWAVTFGSLGAAFFVIQGLSPASLENTQELANAMFIFNTVAHLLTGIGVCFIYDGFKGVKKGLSYVIPVSLVMTGVQFVVIFFMSAFPVAGLLPALVGLLTLFGLYKLRAPKSGEKKSLYRGEHLNLFQAILPYCVIVVLALLFSTIIPASVNNAASFGPNLPGFETNTETIIGRNLDTPHIVEPVTNYNPIRVFRHPAVLLLSAAITALLVYAKAGILKGEVVKGAFQKTVKKGIPATLALLALGNMSLIMMDSGMTLQLARATADLAGGVYPLFAPFIGVLGSFLTGNNTNANVLFGVFQNTIAYELGVSNAVMASVQSMMAGVAVSIGPTLILMGALASNQKGVESTILKKLLPIVLLIALAMGIVNMLLVHFDPGILRMGV
ncbi:MAG: L-lactate permease [Defluviitaleaceae bacterium]|nr:L-lactate permease [Defluviitaleaceae bacterium]MCL2273768.1 L-lactate permease [Defluviitaleaceae bacterium]